MTTLSVDALTLEKILFVFAHAPNSNSSFLTCWNSCDLAICFHDKLDEIRIPFLHPSKSSPFNLKGFI
ncbi:unnamed protein product [Citrullus colocynthis]|uniref:Uncharacterized protein n=1 Tax=Citrullus colocynthis TaxID=252529 RepID=A0ABP0XSR4_9ROSI